jgi:hypothetical protein
MNKVLVLCVAAGLLLLSAPAFAHHGDAGRYEDNVIVMSGTVVELQFTDPHAIIVLDVTENGQTVRWQAELGGRGGLARTGWTKNTLKPGDKISMTGRRAKSGAPYMNLTDRSNVVLTDTGKEVFKTENYGTEVRKRPAAQLTQPSQQ